MQRVRARAWFAGARRSCYSAVMKSVRVGVIGLGAIAERAHLPQFAAARGCQLTAVASSRPAAARAAQARYGELAHHADWRSLVTSEDVDAVAVCSANDSHAEITLAALSAGKHVLVEKPMATSLREAERMVTEARATRRVLAVHHNLRFHPAALAAQRAVAAGRIGRLLTLEGTLCHRGPLHWAPHARWFLDSKRVGGGVLMDLGVHVFDLLRFISGLEIRALNAQLIGAAAGVGGRAEHAALCALAFSKRAIGSVNVSWRDQTYRNHYYLQGEDGALAIDLTGDGNVRLLRAGKSLVLPLKTARPSTPQQAFVDAILRKGKSPLLATAADGLAATAAALSAYARRRSLT